MSGSKTPEWLQIFMPAPEVKGPSIIEQLARPMMAVERLRNGGQPDLADQVEAEIRAAYAEGRKDEAEDRAADVAAEKLIDAWAMAKGKPVPWATAVEIISIVQKLSEAERARLLTLWESE